MDYMIWDESLSVGVSSLDDEHRLIFEFANKLRSQVVAGARECAMAKVLRGFISSVESHIEDEEELMLAYNYPEYESHRVEHRRLGDIASDVAGKLDRGTMTYSLDYINYLCDLFFSHLSGMDMKYKSFFESKGVT